MNAYAARNSVLIIDDDPNLREMIAMMAGSMGIRTFAARNCCEGVQILKENSSLIKIVLLDYFMPGMSPLACANAIRELAGDTISVVLVTAAVDPAQKAAELHLPRWLSKPFDFRGLEHLLEECLIGHEPRQARD